MVLAAIAFGLAAQQLFFDRAAGANVLVATALFLGLAWAARRPGTRPDVADLWLAEASRSRGDEEAAADAAGRALSVFRGVGAQREAASARALVKH